MYTAKEALEKAQSVDPEGLINHYLRYIEGKIQDDSAEGMFGTFVDFEYGLVLNVPVMEGIEKRLIEAGYVIGEPTLDDKTKAITLGITWVTDEMKKAMVEASKNEVQDMLEKLKRYTNP